MYKRFLSVFLLLFSSLIAHILYTSNDIALQGGSNADAIIISDDGLTMTI